MSERKYPTGGNIVTYEINSARRERDAQRDKAGLVGVQEGLDSIYDRIVDTVTAKHPWKITVRKPHADDPNAMDTYLVTGGHNKRNWFVHVKSQDPSSRQAISIGLKQVLMRTGVIGRSPEGALNFTPAASDWLLQFETEMAQIKQQSRSTE